MARNILYTAGMFENESSSLFLDIKNEVENLGASCNFIELYSGKPFGSYSFQKEVRRIEKVIFNYQPQLIVAHSLGGYIATHIATHCPLVLLDPSLNIADIVLPNVNHGKYSDGTYTFQPSSIFLDSIKTTSSIEILTRDSEVNGHCIDIFGAGKGGYKIAEQYHKNLIGSNYFVLPEADHQFQDQESRHKIVELIKKRLKTKRSSRR